MATSPGGTTYLDGSTNNSTSIAYDYRSPNQNRQINIPQGRRTAPANGTNYSWTLTVSLGGLIGSATATIDLAADTITPPPTAPTSLSASSNRSDGVSLSWSGATGSITNYGIWYNVYAGANNIDTTKSVTQVAFVNGFPTNLYNTPDFRLSGASVAAGGASFSGPQFLGGFTGVEQLNVLTNSFNIYPNPATQNTNIAFNLIENNKVSVTVIDMLGNVVSVIAHENEFNKGNNTLSLNTANLANGIYYISLEVNGVKETKKLIVTK
jgi:hypothetical protein